MMRSDYDFSKGARGAIVKQTGKTRISIFIDNSILEEFKTRAEQAGSGYQTMMNEALRTYLQNEEKPLTASALRQVLRQEMAEYVSKPAPRAKPKS